MASKQAEQLVALVQVLQPTPQSLQFLLASRKNPSPQRSTQEVPKRTKPVAQVTQLRREPRQVAQERSQGRQAELLGRVPAGQVWTHLPW